MIEFITHLEPVEVQNLVLILTACIVFWYTSETRKLREEATRQNIILSEQLRTMREQMDHSQRKEKSLLEPILYPVGGQGTAKDRRLRFKNSGGLITELEITSDTVKTARVVPSHHIATDDQGEFRLDNGPQEMPETGYFTLTYLDRIGTKCTKKYLFDIKRNNFKEVPTTET